MSEYGDDCSENDYKEYKDNEEIEEEIDKELAVEKEFTNDSYSQDLDSKEYYPFTPPDLTLKDDDSKEYDPFTPPDLTLKGESSNKEREEAIIKENEPEFLEEISIDHNITFDHIYEKDLEEIVKDIDQAEELHAIYAEDIMIPSGDKEAVEQYYMEQIKAEGVIIANDLYFEETPDKKQATLDHFNEHATQSINKDNEQLNKEMDPTTKVNFTEIDGKEISIAKDIEYESEAHEPIVDDKKIQEETRPELSKSEVKDIDKAQEIPQKYSSGQHPTQLLKQDVEEIPNQESQEIKEENLNYTEEIHQNEVKENLASEVKNEVDKKKIAQEIEKNYINSNKENSANEIKIEKSEFDHKIIEQEAEFKEDKQEKIDIEIDLKEEWEKTLVEWIKGVKDEDLSLEKKVELIEYMRKYRNAREEHKKLHYLNLQLKQNDISEEEKREHTYLKEKIKEYDEIDVEMFKEFHAYRCFYDYNKRRWYDTVTNSKKKRYPKLVAQKLQRFKDNKIKKTQDFQEQNLGELSKEINDERYELLKKRYHQETGKNAIYGKKETKGFKMWKKRFIEIHDDGNEGLLEYSHDIKEEWADVLKNHIHESSDEKISQDINNKLISLIDNYNTLKKEEKYLPDKLKQVFQDLRQYKANYEIYNKRGYDKSIPHEVGKTAKKLLKSLEIIRKDAILGIVRNGSKKELQNFKEILSKNLYKSTMSLINKSTINKIIQKEKLTEGEKKEFLSILSRLSSDKLKSLLGNHYEEYIQHNSYFSQQIIKSDQKIAVSIGFPKILNYLKKSKRLPYLKAAAEFNYDELPDDISIHLAEKYFKHQHIKFYFGKRPKVLTSDQIIQYEKFYKNKLEHISKKYALKLRDLIIQEYAINILGKKRISLSSLFNFRLDKSINYVINEKRVPAIGIDILSRIESEVKANVISLMRDEVKKYFIRHPSLYNLYKSHKYYIKDLYKYIWNNKMKTKKESYIKLNSFIKQHIKWSEFVSSKTGSGTFSISNIKYKQKSLDIEAKSWLFENIRYCFPKKRGLPIRDALLSWFLFGDTPEPGVSCKLTRSTREAELFNRMHLFELLLMDYRISKLTTKDFENKGFDLTEGELLKLQQDVSYYIYNFIFSESTYISSVTSQNSLKVGKSYFIPEYMVIRAIFFATAEFNNGKPQNFEKIESKWGVRDLKQNLYQGLGFGGDKYKELKKYIEYLLKNSPTRSDINIIQNADYELDNYNSIYYKRRENFMRMLGFASAFQGDVYYFMEDVFGISFISEKSVADVVNAKELTVINDDGNTETIKIYHGLTFDGYLELTKEFKKLLGLDEKWIGIAFEAQGQYWHSLPEVKERDRKKRLICKEENVILIKIWENIDNSNWINEIIRDIKEQTGLALTEKNFSKFRNYIGNLRNS